MSGCGDNPAVGKPNLDPPLYNHFNPAGVRLYGLPGPPLLPGEIKPIGPIKTNVAGEINADEKLKSSISNFDDVVDSLANIVMKVTAFSKVNTLLGLNDDNNNNNNSNNDQLIGCLTSDGTAEIQTLGISVNLQRPEAKLRSIGIIHGYSYEGHCYKLPKPQIMFLPVGPSKIVGGCCGSEEDGCECGYATSLGYAVWQIDKLERVVALDVRSDDIKTLVLEQNMPGNRSPQAYAQTMMLSPQRPRE